MFTVLVEMGINDELGVSSMCFDKKMSKWKEQEKY